MTECPECESDLELDGYELDVGENVNCPECSIELKVVATDPIRVASPTRSLRFDGLSPPAPRKRSRERRELGVLEVGQGVLLVAVDLEDRQQARDVERGVDALVGVEELEAGARRCAPCAGRPPARPRPRCP